MNNQNLKNLISLDFELEKLHSGTIWAEGPVWLESERLIVWSDVKSNKMLSYNVDTLEVIDYRNPIRF